MKNSHGRQTARAVVAMMLAFPVAVPASPSATAANLDSAPAGQPSANPARTTTAGAATIAAALKLAVARPAPPGVPAGVASMLAFDRDPGVSAREQDAIMRQLASQPGGGASLEPEVRSGRLLGRFDRLLEGFGYSPRNLGDVMAAHLVIAWEIANGADSMRQPAGQRAVRRQLAAPLASVPEVARMTDAGKQQRAERTAYMTMIWAAAYQELKAGHDPAQLASLQASVRSSFRATGVDLQALDLGPGGLVRR